MRLAVYVHNELWAIATQLVVTRLHQHNVTRHKMLTNHEEFL